MQQPIALTICLAVLPLAGCMSNRFTRAVERSDASTDQASADQRSLRTATVRERLNSLEEDATDDPVSEMAVNGEKITADDILKPIRPELQRRAANMPPDRYADHLVSVIQDRVRMQVHDTLLFQEASKGLTEREEEHLNGLVDEEIRKTVNRQYAGRQTRYERALGEQGSSLADERERILRGLIVMRWLQLTVYSRITEPTRDQLWKTFQDRRVSLATPPRRDMRIVEISVRSKLPDGVTRPDHTQLDECRTMARDAAYAARAELLETGDFGAVAQRHSTAWHKKKGGRFGWVTHGSVVQRLEPAVEALFALPHTKVPSEVIETPDAFFIVQADAIDPGREADFAELQAELVSQYRQAQFDNLVQQHVIDLQQRAHIRPKNVTRFLRAVALAAPQPTLPPRP
ncbi:MAG: peptidylprolyl isomerase [Phycisphaerae bacterium]